MSLSKAKKGQIRSAAGCGATKGSLAGLGREAADLGLWDSSLAPGDPDKLPSVGLVPKIRHLAPHCPQGQTFCLVLRSSRPLFEAFAARTQSHQCLALSDHPCDRQGQTSQTCHCAGSELLAACSPARFVCRSWLPCESSCRYGWVWGFAIKEPKLSPLPWHLPQRPSHLIKFFDSAYELWQDRSPRRLDYRLSNPYYIQPNLAMLSVHHARSKT